MSKVKANVSKPYKCPGCNAESPPVRLRWHWRDGFSVLCLACGHEDEADRFEAKAQDAQV